MSAGARARHERRPPRLLRVQSAHRGRLLTLLDPDDEAEYGLAVAAVASSVETGLGPAAIANRVVGEGLLIEPWWRARRRFVARVQALTRTRWAGLLLSDVADCYGSIGPGAVERALRAARVPTETTERITALLDRFAGAGVPGLPVGPTPSAVLANAVLGPVDRALVATGVLHARWVDDVVACVPPGVEPERVLDALTDALGSFGLEPSLPKTRIVDDEAEVEVVLAQLQGSGRTYNRRG